MSDRDGGGASLGPPPVPPPPPPGPPPFPPSALGSLVLQRGASESSPPPDPAGRRTQTLAATASIPDRFKARAIDAALKVVVSAVAVVILLFSYFSLWDSWNFWSPNDPVSPWVAVGFLSGGAMLLSIPVYEVAMIAVKGRTLGKRAVNIKVVRTNFDEPPGWGRALARWFLPAAVYPATWIGMNFLELVQRGWSVGSSGVIRQPLLLLLWAALLLTVRLSAAWNRDSRGWHDRLAGTRVVKV